MTKIRSIQKPKQRKQKLQKIVLSRRGWTSIEGFKRSRKWEQGVRFRITQSVFGPNERIHARWIIEYTNKKGIFCWKKKRKMDGRAWKKEKYAHVRGMRQGDRVAIRPCVACLISAISRESETDGRTGPTVEHTDSRTVVWMRLVASAQRTGYRKA